MTKSTKPRAPAKLGARGAAFWRAVVDRWEFGLDEVELLVEIVRLLDVMDELAKDIDHFDSMLLVTASGSVKLNPAIAELRASKLTLGRLLGQLGLPDEDGLKLPTPVSAGARRRADRRWQGGHSA